jgi:hypothetical protein
MNNGYRTRYVKPSQVGYKRGRKSSTVDSRPPSDAFRAGADRMGWQFSTLKFCPNCDMQLGWCECAPEERAVAAALSNIDRRQMAANDYVFYPGNRDDRAEPGEQPQESNG